MSLFGNLGKPSGSSNADSLFNVSTLAGSSNNAQQQQQQQNPPLSLFGVTAPTTATPAQQQQPSLFGGDAARPSLFGGGATTTPATTTTTLPQAISLAGLKPFIPSYGGTAALKEMQQQQQQQQPQQGPPPNAATPATGAYFDSLLAKSKKQADGESALGELPSLQLGLGDLRQRLRKIGPRAGDNQTAFNNNAAAAAAAAGRSLDGRAHYLLAASGVDPGAAVRDLSSLGGVLKGSTGGAGGDRQQGTTTTAGGGWSAGEMDVDAYLANLQTKTTLGMIADGLDRSVRDFDSFLEDNVTMEWEAQRKRIYQHFGIKPREDAGTGTGTARGGGGTTATPGGGARESQGGFGRSRRGGNASTRPTDKGVSGGSVFGRSGMRKSVIGTPSRIGAHTSEFSDVDGGLRGGNGGNGGGGGSGGDTNGGGSLGGGGGGGGGSGNNGVSSMDDRFRREKQARLAEKMHALNDARQFGEPVFLCRDLAELEEKSGDRHAPHVVQAYRALMEIVGERPDSEAPRERQFARMYLDPNVQSANAIAMRRQILQGANRFLEARFFDEVSAMIAKHPAEANLGGKPDVVSKIKAYIRIRIARKTFVPDNTELQNVSGEYVWAIVFYLLRAGFVSEAAQYVNNNQNHFRSIDRTFSGYINSYAASEDRRLKRAMQERCMSEYNQRVRNAPEGSIDPFRMACYKIVGRCDVANRSLDGLQTDVNDWIWLQFNLAREGDRSLELASETYGLAELQASIREIGLKHFPKASSADNTGSFGMFFYLQVLSGLFEQAVAYLYPFSYVDAVHFAIALEYYGLLRPVDELLPSSTESSNELLSHNTRGQPQLNFGRMLGYYTRDFRAANVGAAVDYLVLICLNADDEQQGGGSSSSSSSGHAALCHTALRELVLETREFSKLIGDIRPDGQRIRGLIEERGSLIGLQQNEDFIRQITLQAANYADDNGRTTDAVLLYHLAEDYDAVVAIVSRALSEAISLEMGEDPMRLVPVKPRVEGQQQPQKQQQQQPGNGGTSLSLAAIDDPVELARTMMGMYERDRMFRQKIREPNRVACNVLLQMSVIKGLVEAGEWPQALDKIEDLQILPINARGDPGAIRNYAARFAALAQPVAANVPNLLMWTVACCTRQREQLSRGTYVGNAASARQMEDKLRHISVDLTTYTSQLRYRFPPHLHEALARASAD